MTQKKCVLILFVHFWYPPSHFVGCQAVKLRSPIPQVFSKSQEEVPYSPPMTVWEGGNLCSLSSERQETADSSPRKTWRTSLEKQAWVCWRILRKPHSWHFIHWFPNGYNLIFPRKIAICCSLFPITNSINPTSCRRPTGSATSEPWVASRSWKDMSRVWSVWNVWGLANGSLERL